MDCRSVPEFLAAARAGQRYLQLWEPNCVTDEDVKEIAKATHEVETFTHIGFFRCNFSTEQLRMLCEGLSSNVKHLLLQYSNIGDIGVFWIAQFLKRQNSTIERLFVCDDIIGDKGIDILASALEQHKSLRVLCVTDNLFSSDGLLSLTRMIRRNSAIRMIHFSGHNNVILDKASALRLLALSKHPEVRADWHRIEAMCYLTVNRLSRKSPFRGLPTDLIRLVRDMLCDKIVLLTES